MDIIREKTGYDLSDSVIYKYKRLGLLKPSGKELNKKQNKIQSVYDDACINEFVNAYLERVENSKATKTLQWRSKKR